MRNAMTSMYMTPVDYGGPATMDFSPFAMSPSAPANASSGAPRMGVAPPSAFSYQEPMIQRPRNFMAAASYRPPPVAPYGRSFGGFGDFEGFEQDLGFDFPGTRDALGARGARGTRGFSTYSRLPGFYGGLNPYGQIF